MHQNKKHTPVLLEPVLHYLAPQKGDSYLDLTAGYGGHAAAILERTLTSSQTVLVDRDLTACRYLRQRFGGEVKIRHGDFYQIAQVLLQAGRQFDLILADLGVNSAQLADTSRGFSFNANGPLDMRFDQQQSVDAAVLVNSSSRPALAKLLRDYGEEPKAVKIARLIADHRPLASTSQLAEVVKQAWPGHSRVHPATRTFQALRIAVNDELNLLAKALPLWLELLAPSGRLAVISFHSLEDRLVKQTLNSAAGDRYDAELRVLTKRPVTATPTEIALNPRSRSAKLRAAVKINTGREAHANSGKKQLPRVQSES